MNWRALTEHPWLDRLRAEEPDRFARMKCVAWRAYADPAIGEPRARWTEPVWKKFVLLRDAQGRSLVWRHAARLFRRAA